MILFRIWCPICSRKCGMGGTVDTEDGKGQHVAIRGRTSRYLPAFLSEEEKNYHVVCPGPHETEHGTVVDLVLRLDIEEVLAAIHAARRGEKVKVVPTVVIEP